MVAEPSLCRPVLTHLLEVLLHSTPATAAAGPRPPEALVGAEAFPSRAIAVPRPCFPPIDAVTIHVPIKSLQQPLFPLAFYSCVCWSFDPSSRSLNPC